MSGVSERREGASLTRAYTVYRAPDGTVCPSRPAAWRHYGGREAPTTPRSGQRAAPRSASVGRSRPSPRGGDAPRSPPGRRVSFAVDSSSGSQQVPSRATVPVAEQQVDLEDAVTFWERGPSTRKPPATRRT